MNFEVWPENNITTTNSNPHQMPRNTEVDTIQEVPTGGISQDNPEIV
jgi:hypothetical protein